MKLPTLEEIEALHRKYAPNEEAFELVWTHSKIVAEIAEQIGLSNLNINHELVRAGCLLHDIGVYKLYTEKGFDNTRYICHGVLGDELLREEGFEEQICRFASHHTGVGLAKEDIVSQDLPLPHQDFLADNLEELLIMYADKFHTKFTPFEFKPQFNAPESYKKYVSKFGEDKAIKFQEMIDRFGLPDLLELSIKWGQSIV